MQRLKNAIYHLIARSARLGKTTTSTGTLLIIRTDEIGDYVLWRNVLPCIRNSARFGKMKITLAGNLAWKDLAIRFDAEHIDEFIWLDKRRFKSEMGYRFRFLRDIKNRGFEYVLNPIFSRSPRVDDAIVAVCTHSRKIGMLRNEHNVASFEKAYDRDLYQEIHLVPGTGVFEFERNKAFAAKATGEPCHPRFGFDITKISAYPVGDQKYAVIFPGSGNPARRWKTENFARVASWLHDQKNLEVVLCGGPADKAACAELASLLAFPVNDLSGQTSLPEFVSVLHRAELLVSVDTGSVHLAAAAGCRVVGIFDGSQYGRFAPYPRELAPHFNPAYPRQVEELLAQGENVFENYEYLSPFEFKEVTAEEVISKCNL